MKVGSLAGRLTIFTDGSFPGAIDVETASNSRFGHQPQDVFETWSTFCEWASTIAGESGVPFSMADLRAPTPAPPQIFAVGLNYADHATETRFAVPDQFPPVFTKFRSSLAGPVGTVTLPPGGSTDWEVEVVVVISRPAHNVPAADAWSYVAGLTLGQDLSERKRQMSGPAPQFSLAKSYPGFTPLGPWIVTVDEFDDVTDIEIGCSVNGEPVQRDSTRQLIFPIPELIEGLSAITPLLPGDIIFSGTPSGVGMSRTPPRFLQPGDELVTFATGIGELRQRFEGASDPWRP